MDEGNIEHVSDTALLTAACRAIETREPDGLIDDPFAERLAGERGEAIAKANPLIDLVRLVICMRTCFMDRLLLETLHAEGIRTVVNLGAGLDTRPWRLDLPPETRWIEADFQAGLVYKQARLANETPRCRLEQVPIDLTDTSERRSLFQRVGPDPAFMITEGLMLYLPRRIFAAIASEAAEHSGIRHWLLDVHAEREERKLSPKAEEMPAISSILRLMPEDHVAGAAALRITSDFGWRSIAARSFVKDVPPAAKKRAADIFAADARKLNAWLFAKDKDGMDEIGGVYLLAR